MLKTFITIFLLLFFAASACAQTSFADSIRFKKQVLFAQSHLQILPFSPVLPPGFCTKNLPFFCDKEYKLEKITKIPFRFRLGSVDYCDKMEGKNK